MLKGQIYRRRKDLQKKDLPFVCKLWIGSLDPSLIPGSCWHAGSEPADVIIVYLCC